MLHAESSPDALKAWDGVLSSRELEVVFTAQMIKHHFQLLDMGTVRKGQNFYE